MRYKAIEQAKQGIIGGKPVKEWVDTPYGAFAKVVRESGVDPLFGKRAASEGELKVFSVEIDYRWVETGTKTYTIEAVSEEEAEEIAESMFTAEDDLECADVDEWEVSRVTEQ